MAAETAMTDQDLAAFLGISGYSPERISRYLAELTPDRRAALEHMARVAQQLQDWKRGTGPKPSGAIVCERRGR